MQHIASPHRHDASHTHPLPPGPRAPALVQGFLWAYHGVRFYEACARRYGDAFTLRLPGIEPMVMVVDPESVKDFFDGDEDDYRSAGEALEPFVGRNSVALVNGPRHIRQRKILHPLLYGRLRVFGEAMREVADRIIDDWPVGAPFPIQHEMQEITLDVILKVVFGVDGAELTGLREGLKQRNRIAQNPLYLWSKLRIDLGPWSPWGRFLRLKRDTEAQLLDIVSRRRARGAARADDVLSTLLDACDESGAPMSDQEVIDEMVTLLIAGLETTATSLAWAIHHILADTQVMRRVREEVDGVIGAGPLTAEHVGKLDYLEATAKEALRLNPVLAQVPRRLARPMRIGRWHLPAGIVVSPCIHVIHRRPDLWPRPDRFDPERFLTGRPSPYAFMPFGGGYRRCLGQAFGLYEMKVVLAQTFLRTDMRLAPDYQASVVRRGITLAPAGGLPVVIARRHGSLADAGLAVRSM